MSNQPNILFLMTDQHRFDALGCVDSLVKTPTLDALAARGIRYSQAVCNVPMCIPSRYSMMLGLYGSQCGVRHNTQIIPDDADLPVPVLTEYLRDLGYQTAGFGKTHWYESQANAETKPSARGFQVRAVARARESIEYEPGALMMDEDIPEGYAALAKEVEPYGGGQGNVAGFTGCTSVVPDEHQREGWLTNKTLEFLENGRDPDRPLFLYLSFDHPHPGFNVPAGYEDLYDINDIPDSPMPPWETTAPTPEHVGPDHRTAAWLEKSPEERRRSTLRYYALCSYVDDLFGRVLKKLEQQGELDNTFILFCSDHGEMLGDRGYRFSKYCLYEASIRVPVVLAGAGVPDSKRGTVDERPAELVDILPTVLHVAGAEASAQLPGRSLLKPPCRQGTFTEMHGKGYEKYQQAPAYCWRTKEWKLILSIPGHLPGAATRLDEVQGELYHLADDPHEWENLYDDPALAEVRERMTRDLLMHLAAMWALYPQQAARARITEEQ